MRRQFLLFFVLLLVVQPSWAVAVVASNLTPQKAAAMISQRSNLYLLDVRTFGEYQKIRLKEAHLIPIDQFAQRLTEVPRDRPVLVYCAVGSRSAQVVNYLARKGYPEIYNLSGGIYSWVQEGLPVLRGGP